MRPYAILCALCLLLPLNGCDALLPTEAAKPGEVALFVHMPAQATLVDDDGRTFYVRQIIATLGEPTLRATDGGILRGDVQNAEFALFPKETHAWARFTVSEAISGVAANLAPAPGMPVTLSILGSYNALASGPEQGFGETMSSFSWVAPLYLTLPDAERIATEGGRYRLVLDPSEWLYQENEGRLVDIESLLGDVPASAPLSRQLRDRLIASAHLERF